MAIRSVGIYEEAERSLELAEAPARYRFGPFTLDTKRHYLSTGSRDVPLTEKLFGILNMLVEANGAAVSKDRFFSEVWNGDCVSDANLAQHILMLRQLLGERARDHSYIVTVPGIGYRFAATVECKGGLVMKGSCEACMTALPLDGEAFMCSYECTFCPSCAVAAGGRCANCGGELVRRPRRSIMG